MNLILRIYFIMMGVYAIPIFLGAITYDTGKASIYPLIIPIIGSIAIIVILQKTNYAKWINYIPFVLIPIGISVEPGFINYTIIGLILFLLWFNVLRPWRN